MPANRRPKTAKKWCRFSAYGHTVDVWVYDEYHLLGEFDPENGEIIVKRSTPSRMHDTLIHELLHFGIEASSAHFNVREEFGLRAAVWTKLQERLIRYIAPMLLMLFSGLLTLPRIPGKRKDEVE